MKSLSKVKTRKEKELPRIKALAVKGDPVAMRTLYKVYGYTTITLVDGKQVNLREI